MELCYRYRIVCTIWCSVEVVCFVGIIYGWGSLVFVLKQEGFYRDQCEENVKNRTNFVQANNGILNLSDVNTYVQCAGQATKLNLWFSIAIGFMYVGLAVLGQLTQRLGTRITRTIFICVFAVGFICVAFSSPDIPWLLLPGLCCIGLSGMVMFATNVQVANLYPKVQSTIVAFLCGLFDFSSIIQQLIKIAYENGISRMHSYIFLCGLSVFMFSVSTFVFLPKDYIVSKSEKTAQTSNSHALNNDLYNNELYNQLLEKPKELSRVKTADVTETSLLQCLTSMTFILHTTWMSLNMLMFVSFIGLLNTWLSHLSENSKTVNHYLSVFAYTTMCTVVMGLVAGFIYDWQRKRFRGYPSPGRSYNAVVFPMAVCWLLGVATYLLPLVVDTVSVVFPVFITFTFYRAFLFSIGIAFLNESFPIQYFGSLYGVMMFITGLFSMTQYGLFAWNESYYTAHQHVNIFLLVVAILLAFHPIQLWIRGRRSSADLVHGNIYNTELNVSSP